ncbi:MAG TPA: hypothetical protein VGH09_05995, partial [Solirubrobacteraceae bacterium]
MQPHSHLRSSSRASLAVRVCAALLVLFVGADHLYEYSHDDYSVLPTIGTLFLLNFISATLVGALLLTPVKRMFGRFGPRVLEVAALSGFGIAVTSLAALLYSEQAPLFGFMESNYRPAIIVALASEAAATVFMAWMLLLLRRERRGRGGSTSQRSDFSRARPTPT